MKSFSKMCSHHIYSILLQQFVYLPKRKKYKLDSFLNLHHGYSHDQPLTLNLFLFKLFLYLQIIGFLMMPKCRERDHSFHLDVIEARLKIGSGWFVQRDLRLAACSFAQL